MAKGPKTENIGFALMQLIEEPQQGAERFVNPDADSFKDIPDFFKILVDKAYYEVSVQKQIDYIWFYFKYGKPLPRDKNITNIKTGAKKKNPREEIETELLKQLFCLYHYPKNILYLSDSRKHKFFGSVLKEKIGRDFIVKKIFKTKDEFIELIKTVNEVCFTEARNLFNENSKERQALIDLTGTDAPDDFTITARYSKNNIKKFLMKLFEAKAKPNSALKDLIICGTDENNFSVIFNNDTFSQNIIINAAKNEDSVFDPESVKNALLTGIKS